jgi:hypothetical protein
MSTPKTLNPLYKIRIDKKIAELSNIDKIYGGQTEQTLEQRQKEHEKKDKNFCNMKIKKIFGSSEESQVRQINLAETYLIEQLHAKFDIKCLNKAMVGGGGQKHNEGDYHTIYIMYK